MLQPPAPPEWTTFELSVNALVGLRYGIKLRCVFGLYSLLPSHPRVLYSSFCLDPGSPSNWLQSRHSLKTTIGPMKSRNL